MGGVRLHVAGWNDRDLEKPPLLLVHGFRANSHWWDHIAPYLLAKHRVYALDLSGMGRSARRPTYERRHFTEDIAGVARWLKFGTPGLPLTAAGHSYGGSRVLEVCAELPGLIDHAIVLDSPVPLHGNRGPRHEMRGRGPSEPYRDRESILARFRLVPEQPALACARAYIAQHSIVPVAAGRWNWQFDPAILDALGDVRERDGELRRIPTLVDIVRGEHSAILTAGLAARITALLPRSRGPVEVPDAHHHLMLDQPFATISVMRALLA